MSKEKIYRKVQKEVEIFLLDFGFKKSKFGFQRDFDDCICVFYFHKPKGEGDSNTVAWQLLGGVWFKVLDRFFRASYGPKETEPDVYIYDGMHVSAATMPIKIWKVTETTDVVQLVSEFRKVMNPGLNSIADLASVKNFIDTHCLCIQGNPENLSINGLVKAAIAAKESGFSTEYELLASAIKAHPKGSDWFVRHHLGMLSK